MPIYQYQCSECDHEMEALQKMSDPRLTDCPECSQSTLRKQLTAAAFKLKGTGWYETDFKNSGKKKNDSTKSDGSGSGSGSNATASKDSAAKTETSSTSTKASG